MYMQCMEARKLIILTYPILTSPFSMKDVNTLLHIYDCMQMNCIIKDSVLLPQISFFFLCKSIDTWGDICTSEYNYTAPSI